MEAPTAGWSGGAVAHPGRTVLDLFDAVVVEHPAERAVADHATALTYRELDTRARALGQWLRYAGVGPGDVVGLHLTPGAEAIASVLGVLRTGAAYLALDPALPSARLTSMVRDARPSMVLTEDLGTKAVQAFAAGGSRVSVAPRELPWAPAETPWPLPGPDDVAYLIYTSGTTGSPKGVRVPHRGLANSAVEGARWFELRPGARMLQVASWSFDAAVWEICMALVSGAGLVVVPLEEVDRVLTDGSVDAALLTPTVASWLPADRPLTVTTLGLGGERCGAELVRRLSDVPRVLNCYGPTEASICVAVHQCVPGEDPPVGRLFAGTRAYVLDPAGAPVAADEVGELHLGGIGTALGYHSRPDQTARAFVPDPFAADGTDMYRTGDLASFSPSGVLRVHGRTDDQVKVRGVRTELAEIENTLAGFPGVAGCGAVVLDGGGGPVIGAAVVARSPELDLAGLRGHCAETLHPAMVPEVLVVADALPLLPSGKLDRASLRVWLRERSPEKATGVGPGREWADEIERGVATWFVESGAAAPEDPADTLLELGGHSLTAARICARARESFGVALRMGEVLGAASVAGIAELIREAGARSPVADSPFTASSGGASHPLSFGEERLWFLWSVDPGSSAYCVPVDITLTEDVDVARLRRAARTVLGRHDVFRSRYLRAADGTPVRNVDLLAPEVGLLDFSGDTAKFDRWLRESRSEPFDLEHGPLARADVVRVSGEVHRLALRLHHITCDGWSSVLLVEQILAEYRGEAAPAAAGAGYHDFAHWQRKRLTPDQSEELRRFWRDHLDGAPAELSLPVTGHREPRLSAPAGSVRVSVGEATKHGLDQWAVREQATLFHVLLTALGVQLAKLSGTTDFVVGSMVGTRPSSTLEQVVGFFVDTVPIRMRLEGGLRTADAVHRVRDAALAAIEHVELPFDQIVHAVDPPRSPGTNPVVQVVLNMLNLPDVDAGLAAEVEFGTGEDSKFDLTVYAEPGSHGLSLRWVYRTDLFSPQLVAELAEQYASLLTQLADPAARTLALDDLVLDSSRRRQRALDCARPPEAVTAEPVTERFRRAAAEAPERVAVEWRTEVTYRELAGRVDALSGALREAALAERGPVAVLATRTPALAVVVLALLETGVPFALLDRGQPPERLRDHLDNLAPSAVVTIGNDQSWSPTVRLSEDGELIAAHQATLDRGARSVPPGTAYLAHTSGTTGKPKLVLGTRASLDRQVAVESAAFGIDGSARVALLSGLMHDPCLRDLLVPLALGATLSIPDKEFGADGEALTSWLRAAGITVWHTTPGLLRAATAGSSSPVTSVRVILIGGEPLRGDDLGPASRCFPHARLVNVYGTTETPQVMSLHEPGPETGDVVALGSGSPGARLLILDSAGRLAGTGELGEIAVQSRYLALGYRDEPGEGAFAPDGVPDGGVAGPLYLTGDLGWWDAEGTVGFAGRRDDQLNVGGVRVEPAEIERLILAHRECGRAVVRVWDGRLTAFVVPAGERGVDEAEVRERLSRALPDSLLPELVVVREFRHDRNGKFAPAQTAATRIAATGLAPAAQAFSPVQSRIAELWGGVLNREIGSATEDFFALGGHSLLVTRMLALVRDEFGVQVRFGEFFARPTVAGLAELLSHLSPAVDDWGIGRD
ncbi:non-ribosomal peptide synthetase [Amycolatopsis umgeniensis]|uniref:Amino acid adenylation domain-containing protein n=1 Tax=Amycolatopsis umgeniensis TaxID=336628 RepID=A0A841BBV8_9PSEU|nr:non-ribosomal peptide synthetase [Amycolatopsis umgeniensis]MBB5857486.1 amino acid adenylation domain-containing protein [Amycolatopsis umgeniensis]